MLELHEHKKELCPAFGKTCNKCNKRNHFAAKCRSKQKAGAIQALDEDGEEVFQTGLDSLDDSQTVTVKLESGSYLRFQADTGAQCNVIPLTVYKRATKDYHLDNVRPSQQKITAYGGTIIPVCGTTLLRVQRDAQLVDREDIRPILGRKACVGMRIVAYLNNDKLRKPDPQVYAVDGYTPMTKDSLYLVLVWDFWPENITSK